MLVCNGTAFAAFGIAIVLVLADHGCAEVSGKLPNVQYQATIEEFKRKGPTTLLPRETTCLVGGTSSSPHHLAAGVIYDPILGLNRESWNFRKASGSGGGIASSFSRYSATPAPYLNDRSLLRVIRMHAPYISNDSVLSASIHQLTYTSTRQLSSVVVVRGSKSSFRVVYSNTAPVAARSAFEYALRSWSEVRENASYFLHLLLCHSKLAGLESRWTGI
jgi:hypothetical protein